MKRLCKKMYKFVLIIILCTTFFPFRKDVILQSQNRNCANSLRPNFHAIMDDRRFDNTSKRVKRLVLDFEKHPDAYRDLDDFLDIIDFYAAVDYPQSYVNNSKLSQALRIAEEIYPDSTDIKVQRAHIYFLQGNIESAQYILSSLEKTEPEHVGVLLGLADCYFHNNMFDKGMAYLRRVLVIEPDNIEVYDFIIQQCLIQCKVEMALQYFKKRIALKSDDDEAFLARVNNDLMPVPQVYEAALKFFEAYLEINPYSSHAWSYIAMAHYELHHDEESLEACEYALAISAQCTAAYLTKFSITDDRNVLYDALNNVPENEKYHIDIQLGESYFRNHQYSSAAPYYRSAVKFLDETKSDDDFNNYLTRNKLANCYMRMGDPVSAEKLLVESIAINPYSIVSYDDLAILYKYEFHDPDRFEQMFKFLTEKFHDFKSPWLIYIEFLLQYKRYDDVIAMVSEAEQYIRDDDDLYIPLAVAYFNSNRKNEACLLLHNMDIDGFFLENMLRKYDGNMLLDGEVMDIILQKRDESGSNDYFEDNYDKDNLPY